MQEVIPTSLLKIGPENVSRAVKMFAAVQKFMEDSALQSTASPAKIQRLELVQKLLHQVRDAGFDMLWGMAPLLQLQMHFFHAWQCLSSILTTTVLLAKQPRPVLSAASHFSAYEVCEGSCVACAGIGVHRANTGSLVSVLQGAFVFSHHGICWH